MTIRTDRLFAIIFGLLAIFTNALGGSFHTAVICALVGIMYAVLTVTES